MGGRVGAALGRAVDHLGSWVGLPATACTQARHASLPLPAAHLVSLPTSPWAPRLAYDGRGNAVVRSEADIAAAVASLGGYEKGLYAEKWVSCCCRVRGGTHSHGAGRAASAPTAAVAGANVIIAGVSLAWLFACAAFCPHPQVPLCVRAGGGPWFLPTDAALPRASARCSCRSPLCASWL